MFCFKKILCPIDFSEASYRGLDKAVEIASNGTAQLCVVHVASGFHRTHGDNLSAVFEDESTRRAAIVRLLCEVISVRVPENIRSRPVLDYGDAATEILRTAFEESADLIVMATHGDSGWRPDSLGEVANAVLLDAPCPVLAVVDPARGAGGHELDAQLAAFDARRAESYALYSRGGRIV